MKPNEIRDKKAENKLRTLLRFFIRQGLGEVKYDESGMSFVQKQTSKAFDHAIRVGWLEQVKEKINEGI
jgi:hypothetical protein